MIKDIQTTDLEELSRFVLKHSGQGVTISQVVKALEESQHMPPEKARHVVRLALDKGTVQTDSDFKLHVKNPKK